MSVNELLTSFLSLEPSQQQEFLSRAMEATETHPFDSEWIEELERRSLARETGQLKTFTLEEVQQRIQSRYLSNE